jgi:saccharopine dehydrogenase-like NADP-dependent oxidoreductase
MNTASTIIIAGAGGIAEAAGLLLMERSTVPPALYIGNRTFSRAQKVARWIEAGTTHACTVNAFQLTNEKVSATMKKILNQADILLDCLPGSMAPGLARLAKDYRLHYVNLTEYVAETEEIKEIAEGAKTGFLLQTGLAPGYINVLAHHLFNTFCKDFGVHRAESLVFKVGALTAHASAPHYYGFTWSAIGVATEYLKNAIVLREYQKTSLLALSERATIVIDGITYEEDLTSGGAADLPDALAGKVRSLDYKTLRYPGHYAWVEEQVGQLSATNNLIAALQEKMEAVIPHVENDQIILYAAVTGKDNEGTLQRREISKRIGPQKVGKHSLRAIQATTAAPLLQAAQLLLESNANGVILQSQIDPPSFLKGHFIVPVYGSI